MTRCVVSRRAAADVHGSNPKVSQRPVAHGDGEQWAFERAGLSAGM